MKIVQCWDDGVRDDIRLTEILRRHGARASFNLSWGLHVQNDGGSWKFQDHEVSRLSVAALTGVYDGFTIANHSLTHPHLGQIAPAEAAREIIENRDALEQHFGVPVTGFAYPFGSFNAEVRELVRESGHVYARTCHTAAQIFPTPDAMEQPTNCHFLAPDFWQKLAGAGEVFYFWGHSYELTTEAMWADFDLKIARLSGHGQWVDLPDVFSGQ